MTSLFKSINIKEFQVQENCADKKKNEISELIKKLYNSWSSKTTRRRFIRYSIDLRKNNSKGVFQDTCRERSNAKVRQWHAPDY